MYLKEAFRYQNFLADLSEQTMGYLTATRNIMKTTQEHMRKKANPDADDEVIDMTTERTTQYTPDNLVGFLVMLVDEREKLTAAISDAKRNCGINIDAEVANNKIRQRAATMLQRMGNIRATERVFKANGYKFNAEGNQVAYAYDVKEVSVIDFDRNKVKGICRKLSEQADEMSTAIDKAMVELTVEYKPVFSVGDSFEDAMDKYLGQDTAGE
ncbi:hypothetical protein [Intestinimonas butyriciproducens]|uniref:hypothetical protein n=1 Tax=Intestinimonas butyriciproducens TaxID=1297617 RepID=UPI001896E268|nr:hypothetical protein [Intestinimonas butyriciproducens]MDB7829170.1 hypothetical protein [Intestinimonas butyriciproducens]